ncbi:MAG TPA: ABC transporter substrate-binding protein [Acidocella sp.]|nr:ABC transporter substrate-binding protein [Acidocella sp.]
MTFPRRSFIAAGAARTACAALAVLPVPAQAEPKPVAANSAPGLTLGALFPLSGPSSLIGDECLRGVQLAVAEVNAAGGVAGKPVLLVPGDAYMRAQSTVAAGALLSAGHFGLVLGSGTSDFSYPGSAAAELAQLPYIEISAPADGITGRGFKFLLRTSLTSTMIANVAVAAMLARYAGKKIGVLFNTGASEGAIAGAALAAWGQSQISVRLVIGYPPDVADLHEPVARLQRAGVEVLLHAAGPDDVLQMFQAAHDVNWHPAAIFGCGDGYALRETAQALGSALDGTFVVAAPFYPASAQPIAALYQDRFAVAPRSADSLTSYVGARLVLDALGKIGGDTSKLLDTLRKTDLPPGSLANGWGVAFNKDGQNDRAFAVLQQWRGGTLQSVT